MTRDESRAREWAAIAVQFHQKAEARGIKIPFPDLCVCDGKPHLYGTRFGNGVQHCPNVSAKVHAARVKALGEAINAG